MTSSNAIPAVPQHVETSPNGRYIRYSDVLGRGSYKTVYKAFDTEEALEVAWNKLHVDRLSPHDLEKVSNEISLLRQVEHKNIIHFYDTWPGVDSNRNQTINFITEQMMSGTLKEYLKKAKAIKLKVIRRWCSNILEAIAYLHSQNPPIMHRDLKCDNIFINGHVGEVKIGDLGLSGVKEREKADSVIGTPEFMAPELYEESYTEKVDIYAFGMCLLEIVSMEYPYSECNNMAQIFKKVFSGEKPHAFSTLVDGPVKNVIAACLEREARRPSAAELLRHPLFSEWEQDDGSISNLSLVKGVPDTAAVNPEAAQSSTSMPIGTELIDWSDPLRRNVLVSMIEGDCGATDDQQVSVVASKENGGFYIGLEIPIRDAIKRVEFTFDPFEDSSSHIAQEMVAEFGLGAEQLTVIREEIDRRVKLARTQREAASRNATPQPSSRQTEPGSTISTDRENLESLSNRTPRSRSVHGSPQHSQAQPREHTEEVLPPQVHHISQSMQLESAHESSHESVTMTRTAHSQSDGDAHHVSAPGESAPALLQSQGHIERSSTEAPEVPLVASKSQQSLPHTSSFQSSQASPTTPVEASTGVLSPETAQRMHTAPAAPLVATHVPSVQESGIGVILPDVPVPLSNELLHSRVPGESRGHEISRSAHFETKPVSHSQVPSADVHKVNSTAENTVYGVATDSVPRHTSMHRESSKEHLAPASTSGVDESSSGSGRNFPHSTSDTQLPPRSRGPIVNIPPRPVSTPITPASSGMESAEETGKETSTVAPVSFRGPETEPVKHLQQAPSPSKHSEPSAPGHIDDTKDTGVQSTGSGLPRSTSGGIPQIVVVRGDSKGGYTSASRRSTNEYTVEYATHQTSTFATGETISVPPFPSSQTSGLSRGSSDQTTGSHGGQGNFTGLHQGEMHRNTSAISPQRSPPGKSTGMRTNSWKSSQSDDSGNNLVPRVPAGKVIGVEHDEQYYLMCLRLMDQCAKGRLDDVLEKLEAGADPQFADYDMRTPLHLASAEGYASVCAVLLEHGAQVAVRDRWGNTPLQDAVDNGHVDVQNLLRAHGAVLDERRHSNEMIHLDLMRNAAAGDLEGVRSLIVAGAGVTQSDYDRRTPLHLACSEGHPEVAELLLVNGASSEARDRKGRSPVDDAVNNGHRNILRVLRQYGANIPQHLFEAQPELENQRGMDLIEHAARGRVDAVKKLLGQGADANFQDYDRRTAMHLSCVEGKLAVVKTLLQAGACPTVRDRWGSTPSDEARKAGYSSIVDEIALWESKRKQRHASIVSFDHSVMNGHDRSTTPPNENDGGHFHQLRHGIASSMSLCGVPSLNLSADDFAAKYPPTSGSKGSGANSSSVSLPATPFDRSEDVDASKNIDSEERLIQQVYDAKRQQLDQERQKAIDELKKKKSVEEAKLTRSSPEVAVVSVRSAPAPEAKGEVSSPNRVQRSAESGSDLAISVGFSSLPNGADAPRRATSEASPLRSPNRVRILSPASLQRPSMSSASGNAASKGEEKVTSHVNPEIRSLVDTLIDAASNRR